MEKTQKDYLEQLLDEGWSVKVESHATEAGTYYKGIAIRKKEGILKAVGLTKSRAIESLYNQFKGEESRLIEWKNLTN